MSKSPAKRTQTGPEQRKKVAGLRAAGFTIAAIAQEMHISEATVRRICRTAGVTKGSISDAVIRDALEATSEKLKNDDFLKQEIAKHLLNDLALQNALREKLERTLEQLDPASKDTPRHLNQLAQALAATQKVHRQATNAKEVTERVLNEPQVLEIVEMTAADVEEMRRQQEQERLEIEGAEAFPAETDC